MTFISAMPIAAIVIIFIVSAGAIAFAGTRLSKVADKLADRTGMGEVVAGALFVGAATSLPGAITSITTAAQGAPGLAIGNALGGLTAQTAFIAVADIFYRRANIEHAAASLAGLAQGVLTVTLLSLPLIAAAGPPASFWGVHPISVALPVAYVFGLRLLGTIQDRPMWRPVKTKETRSAISDIDDVEEKASDTSLWIRFGLHAGVTAVAGYFIGEASLGIVEETALSEAAVGTVFAAIANSLPELVTSIAAVRIGAVSLAVGNVLGGNAFEVLFLSAADFFYSGSIYAEMSADNRLTGLIAILMTAVLLLGMIRRQKAGWGRIGFESTIVLALFAVSLLAVF